jgi:retinol dehydrogenase 14
VRNSRAHRINNVGGYWNTRRVTVDGFEHTFDLNHLTPFLLTNLLLHRLRQNPAPARVVTVASNAHSAGRIGFDDLQGEHPGVVRTSFGAEDPGRVQRLFVPVMRPFMMPPEKGAATTIHVALDPGPDRLTGRYFTNSTTRSSSKHSHDDAVAVPLWQVSSDLVGLTAGSEQSGPA